MLSLSGNDERHGMPHPGNRQERADHSPLICNISNVTEAKEPADIPPIGEPSLYLPGADPISRKWLEVRGLLFGLSDVTAVRPLIRRPPMIELVDHLRLIEREVALRAAHEDIPLQGPPLPLQLLPRPEEVRVVRHVEHPEEAHPPWVPLRIVLPDEDGDAAVDPLGDLGVAAGAEDRAGPGVRIQECDILAGEEEAALGVVQLLG